MNHIGASILFACSGLCLLGSIYSGCQLWKHRRVEGLQLPSIVTNLKKENNGTEFYLEVENTGGEAKFQAEIGVLAGDSRLDGRLSAYWERGGVDTILSKGQTDRIKIGSVVTSSVGSAATLKNRLYFYDKQKSALTHVDSERTYLVMPGLTAQDTIKPKWIIQFGISSHPPMREGAVSKSFEFELSRFEEIAS